MKYLQRKKSFITICIPFFIGTLCLAVGAAIGISWKKSEVIPVVLVKPGIGGFEPVEGSSIGNTWSKSDVKAVIIVKPSITGFEPYSGHSIGITWKKEDILPVMLVEPSADCFIPLHTLENGGEPASNLGSSQNLKSSSKVSKDSTTASPSVIESQIDGDFEGWEGETILKLTNGQIWKQSEYYYTYHYSFMPKVLIYKSSGGYKMKVDGIDKSIGVIRLK